MMLAQLSHLDDDPICTREDVADEFRWCYISRCVDPQTGLIVSEQTCCTYMIPGWPDDCGCPDDEGEW